ncbi:hypothetical protein J7J62_03920 [bacterium]|nr:hypothetical protein [bacterium]
MNNLESLKYIFNTFTDQDVSIVATKDAPRTDLTEKIIYIPQKYLDAKIDDVNRQILLHLLFHERAHILYTPISYQRMIGNYSSAVKFIINVLEDIKVDTKTLNERKLKNTNLLVIRHNATKKIIEENLEDFKKNPLFINALLHLYLHYCYPDIDFDDHAKKIANKVAKKFGKRINLLMYKRFSLEKEIELAHDILNFLRIEIPKERNKTPIETVDNSDIDKSQLLTDEEKKDLKKLMTIIEIEKQKNQKLREIMSVDQYDENIINTRANAYKSLIDRILKDDDEKLISKNEFERRFNIKFDKNLLNLYKFLESATMQSRWLENMRKTANRLRHKILNITRLVNNGATLDVGSEDTFTRLFRTIYDYKNLKLTTKNEQNIEKIKLIPKEIRQKFENGIHLSNELENWFTKDITNLFEAEAIETEEKKVYLFVDVSSSMSHEQIQWAVLTVKAFKKNAELDNFELYKFNTRVYKWNKKGNIEDFFKDIGGGTSYTQVEKEISRLNDDTDRKLFIILTDMHFYPFELERIDKMIGYNQNIIFLLIRKKLGLERMAKTFIPRLRQYFKKYLSPTFDAYVKNLNNILNIYLRT